MKKYELYLTFSIIIVQITGNKNEYTLSEHVKTMSKVSIFCRGTIVI